MFGRTHSSVQVLCGDSRLGPQFSSFAPSGLGPPFACHPRLAAWAVILRSCGAGAVTLAGVFFLAASATVPGVRAGAATALGIAEGAGCTFLKSCGGTSADADVTTLAFVGAAAGGGTAASRPGRTKASVPTQSFATRASESVPTLGLGFASAAWASRARIRAHYSEYSQKCGLVGSNGL